MAQQNQMATGWVVDHDTGEPIVYASIVIKGTQMGVNSDDSGYFSIRIPVNTEPTLVFSFVGYENKEVKIRSKMLRSGREIRVRMNSANELKAVIIKALENPAFPIIRNIIKNKDKNNPDNIRSYKTDIYSRSLIRLKNIKAETIENSKALRSLKDVFINQQDSTDRYTIPLLFTEEQREMTLSRDPYFSESISKGIRSEGIPVLEDADITSDYIDIFNKELNFYNDNIMIQTTPLVSPISSYGFTYYDYRLIRDTLYSAEYGYREYRIQFRPKNPRDAVFIGEFTVYDSVFALKNIRAKVSPQSNIPFVISYQAQLEYALLQDTIPFISHSFLDIDIHLWKFKNDKVRTVANVSLHNYYSNTEFNPVLQIATGRDMLNRKKTGKLTDEEMLVYRKDTLTAVEKEATNSLKELNKVWWVRFTGKALEVLGSGYYKTKKIDFGPYPEMLKLNGMEGLRVNLSMRTGDAFHPNFFAGGFVGFGMKDKRVKGKLDVGWKFNSRYRQTLTIGGSYDSYRVGSNTEHLMMLRENALVLDEDMFFVAAFARKLDDKYTMRYGGHITYEKEWQRWLSSYLTVSHYTTKSSDLTPFTHYGVPVPHVDQQELALRFRASSNDERRSDFFSRRIYMGNGNLPVINLVLTGGRYNLAGVNKTGYYGKAHVAIRHFISLGTTQLRYFSEMGMIMGAVPFMALEVHNGNESWIYSPFKFNTLNNLVVASDFYTTFMFEYNLNGLLFNRLPLIKQLNIKEMLTCKIMYGFQDVGRHSRVLDMPDYIYPMNSDIPYMEFGVGVKNIFQFFAVGCLWRLPAGKLPYSHSQFTIYGRIYLDI